MGQIKSHIEITPGVCGGKPRIAGHRIRVQDIVILHDRMGKDPYEIVHDYPSITLADVYAALVYYLDNMAEIRKDIAAAERLEDELRAKTPSVLVQKLKERAQQYDAPADEVPS
jgi:uncharacterized protein (DUF433 family)